MKELVSIIMPSYNTGRFIKDTIESVLAQSYTNWELIIVYDRDVIGLIQIENLRKNNDYAMWLQAIEKSNCYRFSECLSYYIKHEGSVSSGSKLKLIKWHYILYKNGLRKNKFTSVVLTARNLFFGVIKKIFYKKKTTYIPQI